MMFLWSDSVWGDALGPWYPAFTCSVMLRAQCRGGHWAALSVLHIELLQKTHLKKGFHSFQQRCPKKRKKKEVESQFFGSIQEFPDRNSGGMGVGGV